jgi:hypothetical protein
MACRRQLCREDGLRRSVKGSDLSCGESSSKHCSSNKKRRQGLPTATDGLVGSVARRSGGADWLRIRGSINAISRAQLRPGQCSRWGLPVDYCTVDFVASSTFEGSRLLSSLETSNTTTTRFYECLSRYQPTYYTASRANTELSTSRSVQETRREGESWWK